MRHPRPLISAVASAVLAACGAVFAASTAHAESMGQWGGWTDYGLSRPDGSSGAPGFGSYSDSAAFPAIMEGGPRPFIAPVAPNIVFLPNSEAAGTILIDTEGRRLYFVLNQDEAYDYPISVGREGFTWTGTERISRVVEWPDWIPPKEMLEREPRYPELMYGGIKNPLGAIALYLGGSLYRIHGTNDPKTIGQAASSGCFRMLNQHVLHLATMAKVGTVVKVLPRVEAAEEASLPWLQKPTALGARTRAGG